jgi:hypothetical protein
LQSRAIGKRIISDAAATNAGRLFSDVERHEHFQYVRRRPCHHFFIPDVQQNRALMSAK